MLIDSNIVIYASKPENADLRRFLDQISRSFSVVSYIESLGYHRLSESERQNLLRIFRRSQMLPLSHTVAQQAIRLRQTRRMGLGDTIIAATAIIHGLTLVTHNVEDFRWIGGLELLDPLSN
jgi:predicted nucleic acid-binding protein